MLAQPPVWLIVVAFLAAMVVTIVTWPLTLFGPVDKMAAATALSIIARLATSIMGGYEEARVGTKAPLWSAVASGLFPAALFCTIAAGAIGSARVGPAVIASAVANVLLVPGAVLGGILQQAQQNAQVSTAG